MPVRFRPVAAFLVALTLGVTTASSAQERLKGRMLATVLQDLQRFGLRIVFSSELVGPDLRVLREPRSTAPRGVLDDILEAHGLVARPGPGGVLQVVASAPAPEPVRARTGPPAPPPPPVPRRLPHVERVTVRPLEPEVDWPAISARTTVERDTVRVVAGTLADDPLRAVQSLPHVAASDDFASEFAVRASPFRHLGMVVDGIETPWLLHTAYGRGNTGSVTMLAADVVDRVTLEAGAHPQRNGDHLGAQLTLDIREGARDAVRVSGSLSSTNIGLVGEGPLGGSGRGSWLLAMRQSYRDWPAGRLSDFQGTVFGYADVTAKLAYDVRPGQKLSVTLLGGRASIDEPDAGGRLPLADGWNRTTLVGVAWRSTLAPRSVLRQQVSFVSHAFLNEDRAGARRDHGTDSAWSYRADFTRAVGRGLVEAGMQAARLDGTRRDVRFLGSVPFASGSVTHPGMNRIWWTQSAYVNWRWQPGARVRLAPGVRLSRSTLAPRPVIGPWVLAQWDLRSTLTLTASTGTAYQYASPDWMAFAGRTTAVPEQAVYADVGIEHQLSPATRWRATVYHRRERNVFRGPELLPRLVDEMLVRPTFDTALERLSGLSRGIELQIERRSRAGLAGWLAYSYGEATYDDPVRQQTYWADFDQRHTISAFASYAWARRLRVSGRLRVGSNFPVPGYLRLDGSEWLPGASRNTLRLPLYSRLDLRGDQTFFVGSRRLTLFAELINALDHENLGQTNGVFLPGSAGARPTEPLYPRLPSVGIRLDW